MVVFDKFLFLSRQQLFVELQRLRLLPARCRSPDDPDLNRYGSSWPMIQAAIVAGSYPNIGFTRSGGQIRKIRTRYLAVFFLKISVIYSYGPVSFG